ncbi:TPA: PapG chaperone-binding domain-containing protein [Serratia fonticola]
MTNFVNKSRLLGHMLLVWVFLLLYSSNTYSTASLTEGKIKWEIRNGEAYVISHNIRVLNVGPNKLPCPNTCNLILNVVPGGSGRNTILPRNTTLEKINAAIQGPNIIGWTGIPVKDPTAKLCLTLHIYNGIGWDQGMQDRPKGCQSNAEVGEPPVGPIEPPVSCSLSNGELNHGVIDSAITDGNVSRTNLSLTCSKSATVRIKANAYQPADGVALNGPGGLRSFVTLNGVAADPGITVKANNSASISVESMLRGAGNIAAGSYSGSITLVTTII